MTSSLSVRDKAIVIGLVAVVMLTSVSLIGAAVRLGFFLMGFAPGPSTVIVRTGDKPKFTVSIVAECPRCDHRWLIDADSSE